MMELAENAPFVGWALRVASQAASIAGMIATSVEVGLLPATYELQAKRSMSLNVTSTRPDAGHGHPETDLAARSDHYVIMVQYKGGTTLTKTGPMPGEEDAPIIVTYSKDTGDALPSAPGQQFQIVANIYSASSWLRGKWTSGWTEAVPTDGGSRSELGSIEQLVPLTASTAYTQNAKLNYDGPSKTYVWEKASSVSATASRARLSPAPSPSRCVMPSGPTEYGSQWGHRSWPRARTIGRWSTTMPASATTCSKRRSWPVEQTSYELAVSNITEPAPTGTITSLPGQDVQQLLDVSINDLAYKLGYCYLARNQNLPEDYGTDNQCHVPLREHLHAGPPGHRHAAAGRGSRCSPTSLMTSSARPACSALRPLNTSPS